VSRPGNVFVYRYLRPPLLLVKGIIENNRKSIFNVFTRLIMDINAMCFDFIFIPSTNLDDTKTIFDNQATNLVMFNICL
jgi:hypothetical protein